MSIDSSIDLLIVDDDADFRDILQRRFSQRGFHTDVSGSGEEALQFCQRREFDVVVLDMMMPGMSGMEVLSKLKGSPSDCEVVMLTGQATVESAVSAMKLGAYDYLVKPFPIKELERVIEKAFEKRRLAKENRQLRTLLERRDQMPQMIGGSPAMQELRRLIERAGPSDKAILIQGESGTGKELVARALHVCSRRTDKPMVVINCAALPETLLESELFGHEKGSFTGAVAAKPGLFEVADEGTLFIDEIGELPGPLQAKLLRVLEDGSMRRIGSIKERRVNVRLLAATNRHMADEVAAGRFREDLYYRINVMSLELPPLRSRQGDVPLLVQHFLGPGWETEPDVVGYLERYSWPGNVRQLINAIDRAKILADDHLIRVRDLPHEITSQTAHDVPLGMAVGGLDDLATMQRVKIVEVLQRFAGNKTHAAKALGIERRKLYRLIERYQIQDAEITPPAAS